MARFILRCKRCKHTVRTEAEKISKTMWRLSDGSTQYGGGVASDYISLPCSCGKGTLLGRKVQGFVTEQACNVKCTSAVGHICECSCGGENHGGRHAA